LIERIFTHTKFFVQSYGPSKTVSTHLLLEHSLEDNWVSLWYYTGAFEDRPCSPRAVSWQSFENPLSQNFCSLNIKAFACYGMPILAYHVYSWWYLHHRYSPVCLIRQTVNSLIWDSIVHVEVRAYNLIFDPWRHCLGCLASFLGRVFGSDTVVYFRVFT